MFVIWENVFFQIKWRDNYNYYYISPLRYPNRWYTLHIDTRYNISITVLVLIWTHAVLLTGIYYKVTVSLLHRIICVYKINYNE